MNSKTTFIHYCFTLAFVVAEKSPPRLCNNPELFESFVYIYFAIVTGKQNRNIHAYICMYTIVPVYSVALEKLMLINRFVRQIHTGHVCWIY